MESHLLKPEHPRSDGPPPMKIGELVLSTPQRLSLPPGVTLQEFADDLTGGVWIARYRSLGRSRYQAYRLGSARFEARVRRRRARHTNAWLAELTFIDETSSMERRVDRIVPRMVSLEPNYREVPFDMEDLLTQAKQWRSAYQARGPAQASIRLQSSVHKEYDRLRRLLGIVEQRPEPAERTIAGTVISIEEIEDGRSAVVIEAEPGSDLTEFDRRRVMVTAPGGLTVNTTVQRVRIGRLAVRQPSHWTPNIGTTVKINLVKPFGMRQNASALQDFLNREVEGSWDDLARLLCRPDGLTAVPDTFIPPEHFFCDDDPAGVPLNEEQRRAVAGAVSSPHTFLIQGPPGTGKTEVICEIARQLTARGERVLLLAPSHVAVDEVLSRIGRKPGIRPLRITWSDDRVQEAVHDFLEPNVGGELAGRILKPENGGQDVRWARELQDVEELIRAAGRAKSAISQKRRQANVVAQARVALAASIDRWNRARTQAEQESGLLQAAAERAVARLAAAEESLARVVQQYAGLLQNAQPVLSPLPPLARRCISAMDILARADTAHASAEARLRRRVSELSSQVRRAELAVTQTAAELHTTRTMLAREEAALEQARQHLNDAVTHQTGLGRVLTAMHLGGVTAARRQLAESRDRTARLRVQLFRAAARNGEAERDLAAARAAHAAAVEQARERVSNARRQTATADRQAELQWTRLAEIADRGGAQTAAITDPEERRRIAVYLAEVIPPLLVSEAPTSRNASRPASLGPIADLAGQLSRVLYEVTRARKEHRDAENDRTWCAREWEIGRDRIERTLTDAGDERTAAEARLGVALRRLKEVDEALTGKSENPADHDAAIRQHVRRRRVLQRLPELHRRWCELAAEQSDERLATDIRQSLVRAANLVCATTKGIVGRGSEVVRYADYDTLIVDEASRVTESEFLIGATRARRWVLVGDEHQLPPHVDQRDEYFLHALTALHRIGRGADETVEAAVRHLAQVWAEDEELHKFRTQSVLEVAEELVADGSWESTFRDQFSAAYGQIVSSASSDDADRRVLEAMLRHLVQSLFQRAVVRCPDLLRQELVWQRRMIEPLARIVDQPVYQGRYQTPPATDLERVGVTPLVLTETLTKPVIFVDTSHYQDAGDEPLDHGFINKLEQVLVERLCRLYDEGLGRAAAAPITVSVLAFYRAQAQQLAAQLRASDLPRLKWEVIDVVDRIQGQQSDVVIISFTRARTRGRIGPNYGQWLQDIRRLNVAFTRARRALVIVGHGRTLRALADPGEGGVPGQARIFYENLFHLIDQDADFMRIRRL
ncbi:AAA domain-containing protein [Micromonospora sp. NPDC047707]|uniref:AAA domain-containing protein n=1 Tax=Micromonospora sp. NPDC047707 TaxID=3154498 RepID=UPI0034520064